MEIIKAILSVLTWMDYLFVAVVMLLITYMGGAFCRDIREMHASRARTRARAEWIEEHPDQSTFDEKNDTAIGHQENARRRRNPPPERLALRRRQGPPGGSADG